MSPHSDKRAKPELHHQFRSETAAKHKELDSLEILKPLKGTGFDAKSYLRSLEGLYAGHYPLEKAIQHYLDQSGSLTTVQYQYRSRSEQLFQDIAALAGKNPLKNHPGLTISSVEQCLGLLYVLEGSKLGSRYIHRMLMKHQDLALPCQFFASCETEQQDWQQFWQLAQNLLSTDQQVQKAINAANAAFTFYIEQAYQSRN